MRPGRLLSAAMLVLLLASPALASDFGRWNLSTAAFAVALVYPIAIVIALPFKVFRSGQVLCISLVLSTIAILFVLWESPSKAWWLVMIFFPCLAVLQYEELRPKGKGVRQPGKGDDRQR